MPETVSVSTLIWFILVDLGVLAAFVSLMFRRFEKRLDKRDREKDEKEKDRQENMNHMITLIIAALSLGEATAEAVQRIPDAHCNGDMHEALDFAKEAKKKYREFEREQTAKHMS